MSPLPRPSVLRSALISCAVSLGVIALMALLLGSLCLVAMPAKPQPHSKPVLAEGAP